jgi:hypothetical protein
MCEYKYIITKDSENFSGEKNINGIGWTHGGVGKKYSEKMAWEQAIFFWQTQVFTHVQV